MCVQCAGHFWRDVICQPNSVAARRLSSSCTRSGDHLDVFLVRKRMLCICFAGLADAVIVPYVIQRYIAILQITPWLFIVQHTYCIIHVLTCVM